MTRFIRKVVNRRNGLALLLGLVQAWVFNADYQTSLPWLPTLTTLVVLSLFIRFLITLPAKSAMIYGYCFGLGLFGYGINWIYISMDVFGGAPLAFALLANAFVVAYCAIYYGVGTFLVAKLAKTTNLRLLLVPPIFALLEWVRSVFFIGFPWLSLGYATIETPIAILSRLGGVFFVTFVLFLLATVWQMQICAKRKSLSMAALFTSLVVGIIWLSQDSKDETKKPSINVALVQGNMDVITKFDPEVMDQSLIQYEKLTEQILKQQGKQIDLVVWPETAVPYFYQQVPHFRETILLMQQDYQFDFISGVPKTTDNFVTIYNAIFAQTQEQTIDQPSQFYYKSHLLAFGEYLPMRGVFDFFRDYVTIPMSDFARGQTVQPPFNVAGIQVAPSICFEAVFGDEIRQNARQAELMVNLSNDGWFGRSKAQAQHLNIARMRAIENQKPLVRATNNGITAIINEHGKVTASTPPFSAGYAVGTVTPNKAETIYSQFGDRLGLILYSLMIIGIMLFSTMARKTN